MEANQSVFFYIARNCFLMVVLDAQIGMHFMKIVGVYKLKSHLSCNSLFVLFH